MLLDGLELIVEAIVRAGANACIGYPSTPANGVYRHGNQRSPIALSAPDEITIRRWIAGFSAAGRLLVTEISFPGLALIVESINMAYMIELPMVTRDFDIAALPAIEPIDRRFYTGPGRTPSPSSSRSRMTFIRRG